MSLSPRVEIVTTHLDNVMIISQKLNGKMEGLAIACFADYKIYYSYQRGIIEGPAFKTFSDGSVILFNYSNNEAEGRAIKKLSDGSLIHFFYERGIAKELNS